MKFIGGFLLGALVVASLGATGWNEWRRQVDRDIRMLKRESAPGFVGDQRDWEAYKKRYGIREQRARTYRGPQATGF